MADIDKLAVQDRVKFSYKISPKDSDKTSARVCVENTAADPIPVEIVDGTITDIPIINEFNAITSVAASGSATVLTYAVPAGKTLKLKSVEASSDSVSEITVEIDSANEAFKRLTHNDWNANFPFEGFPITTGKIVKIIALNCSDDPGKFEGRIIGALI